MSDDINLKKYVDMMVIEREKRHQERQEHMKALLAERDKRDEQRFQAQQMAIKDALLSQEKAVQAALTAAKEAVTKAEVAAEKRFDGVNEFRRTLSDQTATFIPRAEATIKLEALEKEIDELKTGSNIGAGKTQGIDKSWAILLGGLGGVATIISIILAASN